MKNKSIEKRREIIIEISKGMGLSTPAGDTPKSESQLMTTIIDAFQRYGNDWPHKMLELIERQKAAK